MSKVNLIHGKFFLHKDSGEDELLLDVRSSANNLSRLPSQRLTEKQTVEYPLSEEVTPAAKKIFKKTSASLAELVTYLRIVARLLRKPQVHNILLIGGWSTLAESLAKILPQFNPANKFYCLTEMRPLGKIPSVIFIFAEGGNYLLPENKFDTIIFTGQRTPPLEVLLAVRDYGAIYSAAQKPELEEFLKPQTKIFSLTKNIVLFETQISPAFRKELLSRTPQGKLAAQKNSIARTLAAFSNVKKFSQLDGYIAEVARAEKTLAEIFPALHSSTIKFNFNLLKEFLIDARLAADADSKKNLFARAARQHKILIRDWNNS